MTNARTGIRRIPLPAAFLLAAAAAILLIPPGLASEQSARGPGDRSRSMPEAPAGGNPAGEPDGHAPQTPAGKPEEPAEGEPAARKSEPEFHLKLAAPADAKHPVFLYLQDGLRAAELPAFGYHRNPTPFLTRLMETGVTYTAAYAPSPSTVPSVASILTSLYPSAHGVQKAGERLPRSARTLAEVFKEQGYETALFSGHPLVGPLSGLDQGFDWIEEVASPLGPPDPRGPGETSASLNARVLEWLDGRKPGAAVFVVVVTADTLAPMGAPEPEGSRFTNEKDLEWYRKVRRKLLAIRPGPVSIATPGDLEQIGEDLARFTRVHRDVYDGALFHNDQRMGDLIDALMRRGIWEKTLFVAAGTRGEELGERGLFGHGVSLYDTGIRVPVVMSFPPLITSPRQMRKPSDHVDLFPTILSLLSLPLPEGLQGVERNVEVGPELKEVYERPAYAEMVPAGALDTGRAMMIIQEGAKLIVNEKTPRGVDRPEMELFRQADPKGWESRNIVASAPLLASKRREVVDGWRRVKGQPQLEPDPSPAPAHPRLQEILRALGHLQDAAAPPGPPAAKPGKKPPRKSASSDSR